MDIHSDVSLKPFNSFGVVARARYFVEITTENQLAALIDNGYYRQLPWLVLGAGTNILFTGDFAGLILKMAIKGISVCGEDENYSWLRAGAGESWDDLVQFAAVHNYSGLENLAAIPGSVGAAPVQNIGAYGVEVKDVLVGVEIIWLTTGQRQILTAADCCLAYRDSTFKNALKNQAIITAVEFRLNKKRCWHLEHSDIRRQLAQRDYQQLGCIDLVEVIRAIRRKKLPDPQSLGNAGSFFKNPMVSAEHYRYLRCHYPEIVAFAMPDNRFKLAAAWLIEQCGWKGRKLGHSGCYAAHALVLVNYGQASGRDIWRLARSIQQSVAQKFAVTLQPEVEIIEYDNAHEALCYK